MNILKNITAKISVPRLLTILRTAGALGLMGLVPATSSYADVHLTIQNGRVSIVAKDATVAQILAEWSRVGQTKIVNAERVPGGPITIELSNVPEEQALDVLLRSVSGYMAAPRAQDVANLSRFDRIIVMPTSTPPRAVAVSPTPAPAFAAQTFTPPSAPATPPEEEEERTPGQQRPTVFNPFSQPQVVNPQAGSPTAFPGVVNPGAAPNQMPVTVSTPGGQPPVQAPAAGTYSGVPTTPYGGVAVPGMIAQPPPGAAQPGQVVAPGQQPQPQQPRRPEGGE